MRSKAFVNVDTVCGNTIELIYENSNTCVLNETSPYESYTIQNDQS